MPGAVAADLWDEHISRYRFATLFSQHKRVLDVGCGTGYGTELLATTTHLAFGTDIAPEAITYASSQYPRNRFLCASSSALPFPSKSFELITAFELIEHVEDWEGLIAEADRVLAPDGIFLVSTPNRLYPSLTLKPAGSDQFHIQEFELNEFRDHLWQRFPFVHMMAQSRQEAMVFSGAAAVTAQKAFIPAVENLSQSPFFLAVCSRRPVAVPSFSYVCSAGNLLRERDIKPRKAETAEALTERLLPLHSREKLDEQAPCDLQEALARIETAEQLLKDLLLERELVKRSLWLRIGAAIGVGPWSSRAAHLKALPGAVWHAFLRFLFYLLSPVLLFFSALVLAAEDLCFQFVGNRQFPPETAPRNDAASIIIPNWNGQDLLKTFLPFLMAAIPSHPDNEVIVVDNASTDGSVEFLRANYREIKVLEMERNLGFGGAVNRGVEAARNDIAVLLNNDMRVEPDFLPPLLHSFTDPLVFAASSQIFLSDSSKPREETGLTEIWWEGGRLRVGHRIDHDLKVAYPCAYAGGGSSAFDRRKFLELGGFDSLFHPFYYEDTDLSLLAWKRGWKVLYQPASVVYHEHRGTIGKAFSATSINGIVQKNALLYCWKNIHDWNLLARHFSACLFSCLKTTPPKQTGDPCNSEDVKRAFFQLNGLVKSRWKAMSRRKISDREAFRRPLGGYFRDRFSAGTSNPPDRLNILFAAPYPIEPPVHGGAVFMKEALTRLSCVANVHLVSFVDFEEQLPEQQGLLTICASAQFMRRPYVPPKERWTLVPFAVREFDFRDFAWNVHRAIYTKNIDVIQLEYTNMGQYAGDYRHIPCMLFEHDVAFQALGRRIRTAGPTRRLLFEYLRLRLYEPKLLRRMTRIQVCTRDSAAYLERLIPRLRGRIDWNVRAGIDVCKYNFVLDNRESDALLFVGSFRHLPNSYALSWFVAEVLPLIVQSRPDTLLMVVGSDPPKSGADWMNHPNVRVLGPVPDVQIPLQRYTVFVCPILNGSGVRVKLLEAFACGIPAVSTSIGAEGLTSKGGDVCEIADTPAAFADATLKLLRDIPYRNALAERARKTVERDRNSRNAAVRLEAVYRAEVNRMRANTQSHKSTKSYDRGTYPQVS